MGSGGSVPEPSEPVVERRPVFRVRKTEAETMIKIFVDPDHVISDETRKKIHFLLKCAIITGFEDDTVDTTGPIIFYKKYNGKYASEFTDHVCNLLYDFVDHFCLNQENCEQTYRIEISSTPDPGVNAHVTYNSIMTVTFPKKRTETNTPDE